MADWKLRLYHQMPPIARNWVASMRGYQLRSWRYGPETEHLIEEALDRESWSTSQWQTWRDERLAFILHRAATQVPHYRDYWQTQRRMGDNRAWDLLHNWPVLTKEEIRRNPERFLGEDQSIKTLFCDRTSGTTGTPLPIWMSRDTTRRWFALVEARTRRWYGVSVENSWAMIGGQLIVPPSATTPPYWVWNSGLNQLYMSAFHISSKTCKSYVEAINRYGVDHIVGYSSAVLALANLIRELRLDAPKLSYVYTNAEALEPQAKEIISKTFRCPVQSTYSMTEMAFASAECPKGNMHIWPEVGILEIFHAIDERPLDLDASGRFILTGLFNPDMLFIRYDIGDWGGHVYDGTDCGCNHPLPILGKIDGRSGNIIRTTDGRSIFWANNVLFGLNIRELQVIQESLTHLRVRVVPASGYSQKDHQSIVKKIQDRVGEVQVHIEIVDQIERAKNGKFQAVVSYLKDGGSSNPEASL